MINLVRNKLCGYATIKINGVRITIRKLTPRLFLDSEKSMFPFSIIIDDTEKIKNTGDAVKRLEEFKHEIKEIIIKAIVTPKIDDFIDDFMESEHYMTLFSAIFLHSVGDLKKKTLKKFQLVKQMQLISIS